MSTRALPLVIAVMVLITAQRAAAHCQVPCGIFDDKARVHLLQEDAQTIEKAVTLILELAKKKDALSQNQLVRWVNTKEDHAEKIMRMIADYFMAQKIKPSQPKYLDVLAKHHAVMLAAMVCKQTVDPKMVTILKKALEALPQP